MLAPEEFDVINSDFNSRIQRSLTRKTQNKDTPKDSTTQKSDIASAPTESFSKAALNSDNLKLLSAALPGLGGAALVAGVAATAPGLGLATAALGGMASLGVAASLGSAFKSFSAENLKTATKRTRNADGRFRQKSGATQLDTLRETYGPNFAAGLPGNMPLQVLRAATGMSLTKLVQNPDMITEKKEELSTWTPPEPAPGGRTRNADGRIRQKRGDTKIDTLRESYGLDFAAQLPGNWPLALIREATGMSLTELTKKPEKISEALPKIAANAVGMNEALDLPADRAAVKEATKSLDQGVNDLNPNRDVVATPNIGGKQLVASMPYGHYVTTIKSPGSNRMVTHMEKKDGPNEAVLTNKPLWGKKPLATSISVAYHDNGTIASIRDDSPKLGG